jgi:hypothetical protein
MQRGKPPTVPKVSINFKLGTGLLGIVDEAVLYSDQNSRNLWLVEAIERLLLLEKPEPFAVTASTIIYDRIQTQVRAPTKLVDIVNSVCIEQEMDRTLWVLDAILNYLAEMELGYLDTRMGE